MNDGLVNFLSRHFHRNLTAGPRFQSPGMKGNPPLSALVTVYVVKKPVPKPRDAASHAGTTKTFDKRVCVSEQQKAKFRFNCLT